MAMNNLRPDHYQMRRCNSDACRLRFPTPLSQIQDGRCPRCGAATIYIYEKRLQREIQRDRAELSHRRVEALLDNIRSAWNVGSMFRTADGAGVLRMHLCGFTSLPDHPRVIKTALGAQENIPWIYTPDGVDAARALKADGCRLWALEDSPGSISLFDAPHTAEGQTIVLVVGNEVSGVDEGILELCDLSLYIPMGGIKKSYNAAVAFGIAAVHLCYT
jgi:tRNA G18 (ribose-2'-O)-methylase SpoU